MSVTAKPPSARQMRYLRSLATQRGESFAYPRTAAAGIGRDRAPEGPPPQQRERAPSRAARGESRDGRARRRRLGARLGDHRLRLLGAVEGGIAMSVVHCKRSSYDVYIGRGKRPRSGEPGRWGNPFRIGRATVVIATRRSKSYRALAVGADQGRARRPRRTRLPARQDARLLVRAARLPRRGARGGRLLGAGRAGPPRRAPGRSPGERAARRSEELAARIPRGSRQSPPRRVSREMPRREPGPFLLGRGVTPFARGARLGGMRHSPFHRSPPPHLPAIFHSGGMVARLRSCGGGRARSGLALALYLRIGAAGMDLEPAHPRHRRWRSSRR